MPSGRKSARSSRRITWWSGDFTIIGIRMKPDGILQGMVHQLGWEKYQSADNPYLFTLPETTLPQLAENVAKTWIRR